MLNFSNREEIYIATKPVDMRRSFDGLSIYIQENLNNNPLNGKWFVFFNKKGLATKRAKKFPKSCLNY